MVLPRPIITPDARWKKRSARRIRWKDGEGIDYLSAETNGKDKKERNKRRAFTVCPWRVNRWCKISYGARSNFSHWSLVRASSDKQVTIEFMLVERLQIQHHPIFKSANIQVANIKYKNYRIRECSLYNVTEFYSISISVVFAAQFSLEKISAITLSCTII